MKTDAMTLIERCEAAQGGDRELSGDVLLALDPEVIRENPSREILKWAIGHPDRPDPLASIDGAVALVDRVCRIYSLTTTIDPSGNGAKLTWWPNGLTDLYTTVEGNGVSESPAIAIILALLRSQLKGNNNG